MSHFVKGVSEDLIEECRSAMFHANMYISRFMVHDQHVEETRLQWKNRE